MGAKYQTVFENHWAYYETYNNEPAYWLDKNDPGWRIGRSEEWAQAVLESRRYYMVLPRNCFGKRINYKKPIFTPAIGSLAFLSPPRDWGCSRYSISPGWSGKMGMITDQRSLEFIALGCCPPELMSEFLKTEAEAGRGPDAVVEAMKLHKRGYFGGGG